MQVPGTEIAPERFAKIEHCLRPNAPTSVSALALAKVSQQVRCACAAIAVIP